MFTGIVEERGEIVARVPSPVGVLLTVRGPLVAGGARPGDSIAVNGCCLTVVEVDAGRGEFTVDVIAETLRRTSLHRVHPGTRVNLERALPADGRLSGHLVQGHVDGTGTVRAVASGRHPGGEEHAPPGGTHPTGPAGDGGVAGAGDRLDEEIRWITVPADLSRYVAPKGSVAIDGVSLTVVEVRDDPEPAFSVALIPTTLRLTTLGDLRQGDPVNLEMDVIAKYVERLLPTIGPDSTSHPTTHPSGSRA